MTQNKSSSLAVKYRPRNFATLTGQRHVSRVLRRAVETGQVPQQLLFSGSSGLGKTTVARICAAAILCETPLAERDFADACLKCESCLDISDPERNHPDVIEFDAASNGGKDDIKEISARASLAPLKSSWKIYIIDEAHGLSGPGGQAFLKLLEEPPSHVIFMLATTDPQKMLKTNVSRCVRFELLRPSDAEIATNLERVALGEEWTLSPETAHIIIEATDPTLGVRGTLMTLEKLSGLLSKDSVLTSDLLSEILGTPNEEKVQALTMALEAGDPASSFKALNELRIQTSDASIRAALLKWGRKTLLESLSEDASLALEVTRWQYRLLVETPMGDSWTDLMIARLSAPDLDPDPSILQAQLAQAQKTIRDLNQALKDATQMQRELRETLSSPASSPSLKAPTSPQEVDSISLSASADSIKEIPVPPQRQEYADEIPLGEPPLDDLEGIFASDFDEQFYGVKDEAQRPASGPPSPTTKPLPEKSPLKAPPERVSQPQKVAALPIKEAVKPEVSAPVARNTAATSRPAAAPARGSRVRPKIDSPDVPKAPEKSSRVPDRGQVAAKELDGPTRLFLGAVSHGDDDVQELIKVSRLSVTNQGITLAVPVSHHAEANRLAGPLRVAADKLGLPLRFESL